MSSMQGPKGPTGNTGKQGKTGATGPQGDRGAPGTSSGSNYYGKTWTLLMNFCAPYLRSALPSDGWLFACETSFDGTKICTTRITPAAGTPCNVVTSSDSGATWTQHDDASLPYRTTDIALSSDATYALVASQYGTVVLSTDSFATWTNVVTGTVSNITFGVTASFDGALLMYTYKGYLYRSTDYGASWTQDATSPCDFAVPAVSPTSINKQLVRVAKRNPSVMVANIRDAGTNTLMTYDGGATWNDVTASVGGQHVRHLCISDNGQIVVVAQDSLTLAVSTDYGVTWTLVTTGRQHNSVSMSSTGRFLTTCGSGYSWKSSDLGDTWCQVQGDGMDYGADLTCVQPNGLVTWVADQVNTVNAGLYRSFTEAV
jgi:photosystem II stability/assembly factor-like uncharacterized protein